MGLTPARVTMSFFFTPAASAGPPGTTSATSAPRPAPCGMSPGSRPSVPAPQYGAGRGPTSVTVFVHAAAVKRRRTVARYCTRELWHAPRPMLDLIPEAKRFAIPPISNFFGANFEFPGEALSFCVHAEQAAVVQAMAGGETGIDAIAVSAAPCGYCRQVLYELT